MKAKIKLDIKPNIRINWNKTLKLLDEKDINLMIILSHKLEVLKEFYKEGWYLTSLRNVQ